MTLKREKNEHGASTFEMAFILPLIILPLIFGALDFSRAMYAYHFVAYAAREASRWASVRGSTCAAQVVMQDCGAAASGSTLVETAFFGAKLIPWPAGMYIVASCSGAASGSLCATVSNTGKMADGVTDCTNSGAYVAYYPGCVVQVNVTYYYSFSLPYLSQLPAVRMSSTSQMTISQ
jgi:Flp pilus assembly protein TadG